MYSDDSPSVQGPTGTTNLYGSQAEEAWGGGGFSQLLLDAITRGAKQNILFIAAAGNGGSDGAGDNNDCVANYPSNYDTTAGAGYDAGITIFSFTEDH